MSPTKSELENRVTELEDEKERTQDERLGSLEKGQASMIKTLIRIEDRVSVWNWVGVTVAGAIILCAIKLVFLKGA